jgi:hypothetical protein
MCAHDLDPTKLTKAVPLGAAEATGARGPDRPADRVVNVESLPDWAAAFGTCGWFAAGCPVFKIHRAVWPRARTRDPRGARAFTWVFAKMSRGSAGMQISPMNWWDSASCAKTGLNAIGEQFNAGQRSRLLGSSCIAPSAHVDVSSQVMTKARNILAATSTWLIRTSPRPASHRGRPRPGRRRSGCLSPDEEHGYLCRGARPVPAGPAAPPHQQRDAPACFMVVDSADE